MIKDHNPETAPKAREPEVSYTPFNLSSDTFQQLSTLNAMGYPVDMTFVPNDDEEMHDFYAQYSGETTMELEAPLYPQWVKFVVDADFNDYVDLPNEPGVKIRSDDEYIQGLLDNHPLQCMPYIDMGNVSELYDKYCRMKEGDHSSLVHERDDFPWLELLCRAMVAAKRRYDELIGQEDAFQPKSISPDADLFVAQLIAAKVQPLDGEQLAGIMSDYYELVEKYFPDFKKFKNKTAA